MIFRLLFSTALHHAKCAAYVMQPCPDHAGSCASQFDMNLCIFPHKRVKPALFSRLGTPVHTPPPHTHTPPSSQFVDSACEGMTIYLMIKSGVSFEYIPDPFIFLLASTRHAVDLLYNLLLYFQQLFWRPAEGPPTV